MKIKKIFLSTLLLSALTYTSCTNNDSAEYPSEDPTLSALTTDEVTTSLITDIAIEDVAVIANDQFEAKLGSINTPTTAVLPYTSMLPTCAVSSYFDTTVTPSSGAATTTRTITITFGTDAAPCVFRGHNLKGQIILNHVFTTSATKDVTVTFNSFSVNSNKVEGKATWKRETVPATTTVPVVPAHPKSTLTMIDMAFTTSTGVYLRNGWVAREMISGSSTRTDLTDDVNLADAAYVTKNPAGYLLSSFTIKSLKTPLVYNTSCSLVPTSLPFAGSGTLFITKGAHSAVIKHGTGDCDNVSRLAIDIKLSDYFNGNPVQYNSNLYSLVPVTTPPTTPPTYEELLAKFDAKFDAVAVPYTLP